MDPTEAAATQPSVASPGQHLRSIGHWADWQRAELEEVARRLREVLARADAAAEAATSAAGVGRPVGGTPLTVDELVTVVDCMLTAARVRTGGVAPSGWGAPAPGATGRRTQPDRFEW